MILYIISTEYGDWLLDEELNFCLESDEELEATMVIRIMDTALASGEDWEDWFQTLTDEDILDKIKPMIQKKLQQLANKVVDH